MAKILILVLIVAALAGGGFYLYQTQSQKPQPTPATTAQIFNYPSPVATASPATSSGLADPADISDSALDKDFNDVQSSMNKLDKDQAAANTDTSSQDTPPTN